MSKKLVTVAAIGALAWWWFRQFKEYKTDNYIMTADSQADSVGGFLKASFDSAVSYGQEDLGMNFSIQLLDYLKSWEKFSPNVYTNDGAGIPTIGYGHKLVAGDGFSMDSVITEVQATGVLLNDIAKHQSRVTSTVNIPLSQHQFDALVSFAFNGGNMSQLSKTVNSGGDVPAHMLKYVYAGGKKLKGLVNRRNADVRIWDKAIYSR